MTTAIIGVGKIGSGSREIWCEAVSTSSSLLLEHTFRTVLDKPIPAAIFLTVNGVILYAGERLRCRDPAQTAPAGHARQMARRAWPRLSSLLGVSIERREFLLLGGAVATGAGLAGCTSTRGGNVSPGGSRPGSSPAAPSPAVSLPGSARVQLGPQVVHGRRDRARVALTFHGQGP